jgi:hypothetical protein
LHGLVAVCAVAVGITSMMRLLLQKLAEEFSQSKNVVVKVNTICVIEIASYVDFHKKKRFFQAILAPKTPFECTAPKLGFVEVVARQANRRIQVSHKYPPGD